MRNSAKTLMSQIHIGRTFIETDEVPRLGPAVPQWFGESIGHWDGEALISWTSNIQGWINHGAAEFSNHLQSVEIYTPLKDNAGTLTGIKHEIVLYDDEALVEPVRIVQTWKRLGRLNENDPLVYMECIPHIFPVKGMAESKAPGARFEYEVPDIYGRPWARIWEENFEKGMLQPAKEQTFDFSQ
jgi:hypothetical protein